MADSPKAKAFQSATWPYLAAAMTLARWLTRDAHDAEDIVQEAYLRAYKYFDSFDGQNPRAWLLSIVRHTFYSAARQRRQQGQTLSYDDELNAAAWSEAQLAAATELSAESALLRREEQGLIRQALGTLPDEFREVLVLRELEDLSYKDIALVVGIPIGTVMSRLSRARGLLAQAILRNSRKAS